MSVIFISYRRSDSQDVTGRIYDRLAAKYTKEQVFKDVDNFPLGITFPAHLKSMLGKSSVVLVIIGPSWLTATDEQGRRRLDDPNDFVRVEVETALRANVPVIPVLVSNTRMPLASELPNSIRRLVTRQGSAVRPDPDFNNDIKRLFAGIEHVGKLRIKPKEPDDVEEEEKPESNSKPPPSRQRLFVLVAFLLVLSCVAAYAVVYLGLLDPQALLPEWFDRQIKKLRAKPEIKGSERPTILDCTGPQGANVKRVQTAQKEWADHLKLQVVETFDLGNAVKLEMILVPPGKFMMGSPDGKDAEVGRSAQEKLHEIELTRPYFLAKYPVTQEQFRQMMEGANPSWFSEFNGNKDMEKADTKTFPVEGVSHEDAKKFCAKLAKHGRGKFTTFRLPTEAEWEYACRAGTRSPFHFGASLNDADANCNGELPYGAAPKGKPSGRTCKVGKYGSNALGLHDMHGNVWQWCQDWFGDYDEAKRLNPKGAQEGTLRVCRGGSCFNPAASCRSAYRNGIDPVFRGSDLGFRPALVQAGGE